MEGTMSEIRLFAGDFAPKYWNYCDGSIIAISTNQALFALLGTMYGGNGINTFALPDLRGRTVLGAGTAVGLSSYTQGEVLGTEMVTLLPSNLPAHTHIPNVTPGTGQGTGSATLYGIDSPGTSASPAGNYLAQDSSGVGAASYASSGTPVAMHAQSVVFSNIQVPTPGVVVGNAGGSMPHTNIMPSLALNYIICLQGIFPSRN